MRLSYWIAGPVSYMLVRPLGQGMQVDDCVALYTPIKLRVESWEPAENLG